MSADPCGCACCEPPVPPAPGTVFNPPGLPAVEYRIGTYGSFREALVEAMARKLALRDLTTRDDSDYAIALLDGWAYLADILTFYSERTINESFLRTARLRDSVMRLGAMVGYDPSPGLAATAPLAFLLDALVATGREDEVALAWAQFGLGKQVTEPVARLAAARCLLAARDWRRGIEELWRVELTEPGRDEQVALARCGLLLSCAPLDVLEAALGERVAIGAHTLARRMARDVAMSVDSTRRHGGASSSCSDIPRSATGARP
jgi:hypothetical protein